MKIGQHSHLTYSPYRVVVEDCKTQLKIEDLPFGEVTAGCLTLLAVVMPFSRAVFKEIQRQNQDMKPPFPVTTSWDFSGEANLDEDGIYLLPLWLRRNGKHEVEGIILQKVPHD